MSQSDLEMKDAENIHCASEQNPQDSKSEVVDSVATGEAETLSCVTDAKSNGSDKPGEPSDEEERKVAFDTPPKDTINFETPAVEQTEGPAHEQIVTDTNNEMLADMNAEEDKEGAKRSTLDIEVDTKEEASKLMATETVEKEGKACLDPADVVSDLKEAEEIVNDDAREGKVEHISNEVHNFVETIEDVKTQERTDNDTKEITKLPVEASIDKTPCIENGSQHDIMPIKYEQMEMAIDSYGNKEDEDDRKGQDALPVVSSRENEENISPVETSTNIIKDSSPTNHHEFSTPDAHARYSPGKAGDHSTEISKNVLSPATLALMGGDDDGTLEDQAAFVKEVESFYRERSIDFKQPKFYGQPLNCLKLWKAVVKLGGYDKVTALKLWRQVGESFHPPKTCTTVSWTFRIFYEKSLLEFERQKTQNGELQLPIAGFPEALGVDGEGNGYQASGAGSGSAPGRARRDSAARAMQGWHAQRLLNNDEVGDPIVKDKNINSVGKREKTVKSGGPLKQKRPPETEHSNKIARAETPKQLVTSIADVGPPADWVKINVRQTQDCFEVYALVPGLLREEVRVQSDPAGRVVITGQPEQVDNPWGITPFKKVVSLPERIDPLQTSAVVSMHGRLYVRVPFEQSPVQPNAQT